MFHTSTDHVNDKMVQVQFAFLSMEMDVKTVHVIVKNKSTTWRQNVKNFAVKPLTCGLWFHMSFGF